MNLTRQELEGLAESIKIEYAALMTFISVESGGLGFAKDTGKIIIQFEPAHFRRYVKVRKPEDAAKWAIIDGNKVEGQAAEWKAFNAAFAISPQAAMECTSIGMGQTMGWNYTVCGFRSVNAMWDAYKTGEYQQVKGMCNFIKNNPKLYAALKVKDWAKVAYYYNGSGYAVNKYDVKLAAAYKKYSA
jgi:hypothetical protein